MQTTSNVGNWNKRVKYIDMELALINVHIREALYKIQDNRDRVSREM